MESSRKKRTKQCIKRENGVWEQKILNKQFKTFYLSQIDEPGAFL